MLIVRISPGLANSIYEFSAAYALAKELGQELAVDIAEFVGSSRGLALDYFKIPNIKKIIYNTQNANCISHTDIRGVLADIRDECEILLQDAGDLWPQQYEKYLRYNGLDSIDFSEDIENIYLCGYFCDRERYFQKYWDEIRAMFTIRDEGVEVAQFREVIRGKTSVGVHIRRGDFLIADFVKKMADDFYRAAISCCREHFGDCVFAIFSDDIEYAKEILGKDSSLYYIHFVGYDNTAIKEFVCLSLCDHRIMTNCSTFSGLADQLNWEEERKTFWQDFSKNSMDYETSNINFDKRNIRLNQYDIKKYSALYYTNDTSNIDNYESLLCSILNTEIDKDNYIEMIEKITLCSLNVYDRPLSLEKTLLYKLFLCHIEAKDYHNALDDAFLLYDEYAENRTFTEGLILALREIGAYEEANIEQIRINAQEEYKHFIVVPYAKMCASSQIVGLVEVGLVLRHLGHTVDFVFEPWDESEKVYICDNPKLTNRQGVCLGCGQFLLDKIVKYGIDNFINQYEDVDTVIIARREEFFVDKKGLDNKKIKYVFPDFSDKRDAESAVALENMSKRKLELLYHKADIICTQKKDYDLADKEIVRWEDSDDSEPYVTVPKRWEWGYNHRLSKRAIQMAQSIVSNL